MGWVNLLLQYGLRLRTSPDLEVQIRSVLEGGTADGLRLADLSPELEQTERGEYPSSFAEVLDEDTYASCHGAGGWGLLYFEGTTLVLDESNGIRIDSNRCYSGGQLEFLRGDFDAQPLSESQTNTLKAIAEKLGVPFKLTFSVRAVGSGRKISMVNFSK